MSSANGHHSQDLPELKEYTLEGLETQVKLFGDAQMTRERREAEQALLGVRELERRARGGR